MSFEDDYLDVLQNIEFAIVSVYREHAGLLDLDVDRALQAVMNRYTAQLLDREPKNFNLKGLEFTVADSVQAICEQRVEAGLSHEEIIQCLKRIRASIKKWTKRGGSQGYLKFVEQFIQ